MLQALKIREKMPVFWRASRILARDLPSSTSDIRHAVRHSTIQVSSLLTDKSYIGGDWVSVDKKFAVKNPFNNEVIGQSADCDESHAHSAIEAATKVFTQWKDTTAKDRAKILNVWHNLLIAEKDSIAKLITLENGKPIAESQNEVAYAADFLDWFAGEGRRTYGISIPSPARNKKMMTVKQPIGVVAMVTPWNFPVAMITRKAGAALAAGCTIVLKPSEETPLTALAIAQLAEKAGIPAGVFNVIPASRENTPGIGEVLCTHSSVAAVSFTGSTATGKILLRHAASTVKKVSLENGGNAPFIVFDTSDVDKAVKGAIACKFRYSGQTCICANRLFVQSGIHDQFVDALAEAIKSEFVLGDGMNPRTTLGPLINELAVNKVDEMLQDAVNLGAEIVVGGKRSDMGKNMFQPTVITGVSSNMKCSNFEIFGPVAPITRFDTEEEVITMANGTSSGLAGYLFSGDVAQCWRVSEKLQVGVVGINEGLISAPESPFGGFKESGLGREGSIYGMDEFMEVKYLCWGI